ncbi:NAD(P)-dependent oxidoreductase [Pseudomonas benzopyrenica]|uniref:NAD(P)-dependent oxidoreductase n=1 Tax=Pseudomonas benzopyrenica TaxID=2993566 RepID=A0ABZ2FKX4_9PSED
MSAHPSIGFIGFGAMAQRMGANLREAGYPVRAYAEHQQDGERHGTPMEPLATLLPQAEVVIVSLPNDAVLEQVLLGADGVLARLESGRLLINTSTNSPALSLRLEAAGRARGIAVVEAPVSGSTPEAEQAQLVVLAGGEPEAVERARPILETLSKTVHHVGPTGQGAAIKLAINGLMGAGLAALAEALAYATRAGLDAEVLFEVFGDLAVLSPHHQRKLAALREGDFAAQFPAALMHKDMGLLLAELNATYQGAPTLAAAAQQLALGAELHPDADYVITADILLEEAEDAATR